MTSKHNQPEYIAYHHNFNICHIYSNITNKCYFYYLQQSISHYDNVYIHHVSCPILQLWSDPDTWYLLYPQFIYETNNNMKSIIEISFAIYYVVNREGAHGPLVINNNEITKKFGTKHCKLIQFDFNINNTLHIMDGEIQSKKNKMGSICKLTHSVNLQQLTLDFENNSSYYLIVNNYIFQIYIDITNNMNHKLSVGIHSPIHARQHHKPHSYVYSAHINHHINIGASAYFIYDAYGDIYNNYDQSIAKILEVSKQRRIDIFIYDIISVFNDDSEHLLIMNATHEPYTYQGIIIGLIYFKSLSLCCDWTLFVDLDEFIILPNNDNLISFLNEKSKNGINEIGLKRARFSSNVCLDENIEEPLHTMIFRKRRYQRVGKWLIKCGDTDHFISVHPNIKLSNENNIYIGHYRGFGYNQCQQIWNKSTQISGEFCSERNYDFLPFELRCYATFGDSQ